MNSCFLSVLPHEYELSGLNFIYLSYRKTVYGVYGAEPYRKWLEKLLFMGRRRRRQAL
jgi:hypothetical protein